MGNSSSNSSLERDRLVRMELQEKALRNYDARINNYNYAYHGPYINYINWCRAEYELECIPDCCRYGPNYSGERR